MNQQNKVQTAHLLCTGIFCRLLSVPECSAECSQRPACPPCPPRSGLTLRVQEGRRGEEAGTPVLVGGLARAPVRQQLVPALKDNRYLSLNNTS